MDKQRVIVVHQYNLIREIIVRELKKRLGTTYSFSSVETYSEVNRYNRSIVLIADPEWFLSTKTEVEFRNQLEKPEHKYILLNYKSDLSYLKNDRVFVSSVDPDYNEVVTLVTNVRI